MSRKCEKCGSPLPIQTGRGRRRKFCSGCSRSKGNQSAAIPTQPVNVSGVYDAIRAELETAGVLHTSEAQAALLLANRIESQIDPGSAIAQMVKSMREAKYAALAATETEVADPVDEFTAKRREREGA